MSSIRAASLVKRILIIVHRWLGVALCLLFLLWFPSGIVMMYWPYPEVSGADRLEHAAPLAPDSIALLPAEAVSRLALDGEPADIRLNTFDGRPVYRIRGNGGQAIVYADNGDTGGRITPELMRRVAARWAGQPGAAAAEEQLTAPDQWTVQNYTRIAPVRKYSWPDGQQVYVSGNTGEVVQATTRATRFWGYLGAVPHWFYFTPLRKHGPEWSRVVIWTSGVGTVTAILGLVIGAWMYSPSRRYRLAGASTSIPYRGQKRLHAIVGLTFGLGAVTWAFSGMLSMEPFPLSRGGNEDGPVLPAFRVSGRLPDFAGSDPRDVLARLPPGSVKELEFTSFDGVPMYFATLTGGQTRVVSLDGAAAPEFDRARIMEMIRHATAASPIAGLGVIDKYDRYYLDRAREAPLPVILARFDDAQRTRAYVDPKTARVVMEYQSGDWMRRWLYHGLHSLNFPWLYEYRPLWDLVVLTFLVGGTVLCVTSLTLAWRVLGRRLRAIVPAAGQTPFVNDDLVR